MRTPMLAAVLTALALSGCATLEPRQLEAEYVLSTVAGDPLPTAVIENESVVITVIADTLRLFRDITGMRITVADYASGVSTGGEETRHRTVATLTYRLVGDQFEADFDCPPNASCIAPPHLIGTQSASGLTLTSGIGWRIPMSYTRTSE